MTNKEVKAVIDELHLVQYGVALKNNIHPVNFSKWLNNSRDLPPEQIKRVSDYLEKLKEAAG
jgi:hypothetical protein